MKFEKYRSIENSYRSKFMNFLEMEALNGGMWHVSEKVHGTNFSMWYNGFEMKAGKKSAFLNYESSNFFNFQKVYDELQDSVKKLWKYADSLEEGETVVSVRGELFGGTYPHKDVEQVPNAKKVQSGLFYCPDNQFLAFDIMINDRYLDVPEFEELCIKFGIPFLPTLFRGTLEECLKYDNEYLSTIPKMFGLPTIEDNICEGNVIRPQYVKYLKGGSRVIIKHKNPKWLETNKEKKVKTPIKLSDGTKEHFNNIITFLTENRLRNVISKIGKVNQKDFGKLLGLFVKDAMEEYLKDNNVDNLEKNERKVFNKMVNSEASNVIRPNFLNIIDGEF